MKEPTFLMFDDGMIDITWATIDKRLCVYIDDETGIEVFGISVAKELDIVEFNSFPDAYKWFEEEEG